MSKQAAEFGAQMAIMDAMEKGHTDKNELISYMKSETFINAAASYARMFEELLAK
jgi:hypothetical protein